MKSDFRRFGNQDAYNEIRYMVLKIFFDNIKKSCLKIDLYAKHFQKCNYTLSFFDAAQKDEYKEKNGTLLTVTICLEIGFPFCYIHSCMIMEGYLHYVCRS